MNDIEQKIKLTYETNAEKVGNKVSELTDEIQTQKDLTIEFQKELLILEKRLKDTPKNALKAQSDLRKKIINLKDSIKDQGLAVKELSNEKNKAVKAEKLLTNASQKGVDQLTKNGGAIATLDRLTGGYVSVLKDAYEGSDLFSGGLGRMLKAVKGFSKGAKAALISTGIGALVVIVGTLVTYWEDIKGLINGVNSSLRNNAKLTKEIFESEEKKLDRLLSQDEILKRQGKTEKEILISKQKQTRETISSLEAQLLSQKTVLKAQIEAEKRNKTILSGILKFVSLPITALLYSIDAVGKAFGKDFGLVDNFDTLANLVFDPEKIEEEGDKAIEETEKKLLELKNTEAGYLNNLDQLNKDYFEKKEGQRFKDLEDAKKLMELRFSEEEKALRALQDLNDKTEEEKLARQKERDLEAIAKLEQQGIDVRNLLIYNDELYSTLEDELREKRAEEQRIKDEENRAKSLADQEKQRAEELGIEQAKLNQKEAIEDAKINIAQKGISLLANVFSKNKAIQKAAIIAENAVGVGKMVIDNNRANIGALATPQAIASSGVSAAPVIALNNITTGIGIASSIAATSKALKALGGGSAGSTAQAGTGVSGGGASSNPQVGFQSSNENQIATNINNNANNQEPIKAYVISGEMTKQQALENGIIESNSI